MLERFSIAQSCLFSICGRRTIERLHSPLGTPVLCFFMLLHHYPLFFVSILYSHPLFPVLIFILTCWFRLRGVITPPTAPGPTWTPHGGTMRAFCPPTGMYHAWPLPINKMCDAPVCWLDFYDLLISLFCVFFSALLLPHFLSFLTLTLPLSGGRGVLVFTLLLFFGLVCSACSVCGVVMRLMRTRFPLRPGKLTWRRCTPAAPQSRYNSDTLAHSLVFVVILMSRFQPHGFFPD